MFEIDNTVSEPLYINVIKVMPGGSLRISELGQPVGCYVLLPRQVLKRAQTSGLNPEGMHLLVATHYYFSIDELMAELDAIFAENPKPGATLTNLPIYIKKLR